MLMLARKRLEAGQPIGPSLEVFVDTMDLHNQQLAKEASAEVADLEKSFAADNSKVPNESKLPAKPDSSKETMDALLEKEITELAEKAILCAYLKTKKELTEKEKAFITETEKVVLDECKTGKVNDMVKKMKAKKSKKAKKEDKK
jgi:hypothetical protein